ncbi:hypothetical protein [Kangiella sp.]|uniref:hypothetical protein n=1 Tax=Kangiella sp. TaxID=1920245 RepID=UPI003A8F1CDA
MIGETLYDVDRDATLESLKVTVGDREIPSDNLSFSKPPSVIDAGARFELSIKDLDSVKSKPIRIEGIVHYYVDSKISSDSEQTVTLELGKTFSIGTWVFSIIEIDKNTVTFNINKHPDRMPSINFFTTEKTKIEAYLYSRSTTVINGEASYSVKYEFKDVHSELIVRGSTIELPKESQKAKFAFDFVTPY